MRVFARFIILLICISSASCVVKKTCSGVSPEIGSANTPQKIRKARRHAHSIPEKQAETHRLKTVKNHKSSKLTKTTGKQGGLFHLGGGKNHKKGGSSGKSKNAKKDGGINLDKKN